MISKGGKREEVAATFNIGIASVYRIFAKAKFRMLP